MIRSEELMAFERTLAESPRASAHDDRARRGHGLAIALDRARTVTGVVAGMAIFRVLLGESDAKHVGVRAWLLFVASVASFFVSAEDMQGDAAPLLTLASGIACAWSMSLSMGFLAIVSALLALALGRAARRAHRAAVCAEMARDGVLIQTWMGAASR